MRLNQMNSLHVGKIAVLIAVLSFCCLTFGEENAKTELGGSSEPADKQVALKRLIYQIRYAVDNRDVPAWLSIFPPELNLELSVDKGKLKKGLEYCLAPSEISLLEEITYKQLAETQDAKLATSLAAVNSPKTAIFFNVRIVFTTGGIGSEVLMYRNGVFYKLRP